LIYKKEIGMFLDLSLPLAADKISGGEEYVRKIVDAGHAGTHFDVMDKVFPLDHFRTQGKVVDVSHIRDREVEVEDLGGLELSKGDFIIFHTGWIDELGYDTRHEYVKKSAELSDTLVAYLVDKGVSLIGVDAAGAQKPKKHLAVDTYCAERNVFIVENLNNVKELLALHKPFTVYTAPVSRTDLTGLPCRVLAEYDA
jgi:kynurenine formamidase